MRKKVIAITLCVIAMIATTFVGNKLYEDYQYNNGWSGKYNNTRPQEGQIRVVCVGDSITYGHSVEDWEENNYPVVLQELLGEEYHVANYGSSGACVNPDGDAPYTQRKAYERSLVYDADILVFMLGTNDSKPQNWTDAKTFIRDYQELLNTYLQDTTPPKVYIGLCAKAYDKDGADDGYAKYNIQPDVVDEIVNVLQKETLEWEMDIEILDVHRLTEAHPEWFSHDGIHPNKDGARAIAKLVAEAIVSEK